MDATYIKEMCHKILTNTDLKAIVAGRGFDKHCLSSRDKFENYFHSVIGLDQAISSLEQQEKIFLYYLYVQGDWVTVDFFIPLYKTAAATYQYGTYTQKYNDIYKLIQSNLIRKGILAIRESYGDSKLERWRFKVPELFAKYLPEPFNKMLQSDQDGETDEIKLRSKIAECLLTKNSQKMSDLVHISGERLYFGNNKFCMATLKSWQKQKWCQNYVTDLKKQFKDRENKFTEKFQQYIVTAFKKLANKHWITSKSLQPLLNFIFAPNKIIKPEKILEIGYSLGCLQKISIDGNIYYSNVDLISTQDTSNPELYLKLVNNGFIVNLKKIPYVQLANLAAVGSFFNLDKKLFVSFKFADLMKMDTNFLESPLLCWMSQQSAMLAQQIKEIQIKHGKVLLHKNILVAKINDLRLKAHIIKACEKEKDIIFLPNDFLAFPKTKKPELEKLIKKVGYAIKIKTNVI